MPAIDEVLAALDAAEARRAVRAAQKPSADAKARFRSSLPWRRLRFAVLAENARRHPDGRARCELCGAKAEPGRPLHVDHIHPVSKHWELRLKRDNLQVLCPDCNTGKLAGPAQDFRPRQGDDHAEHR